MVAPLFFFSVLISVSQSLVQAGIEAGAKGHAKGASSPQHRGNAYNRHFDGDGAMVFKHACPLDNATTMRPSSAEQPQLGSTLAIKVAQLASHNFARRSLWQIGNKLHQLGHLISGKFLATEC